MSRWLHGRPAHVRSLLLLSLRRAHAAGLMGGLRARIVFLIVLIILIILSILITLIVLIVLIILISLTT